MNWPTAVAISVVSLSAAFVAVCVLSARLNAGKQPKATADDVRR